MRNSQVPKSRTMPRFIKALLAAFAILATSQLTFAGGITVGQTNNGNCYPFMCNAAGTSSGPAIDYQQVFASTAFSGSPTIDSLTFSYYAPWGGNATLLGGTYELEWGYAPLNAVDNLSTSLASNYLGAPQMIGSFVVPTGGLFYGPSFTFSFLAFNYNPLQGDLLLEILVSNQDNVRNLSGNGYNQSDDTGIATSRAYCIKNGQLEGCYADANGLVTSFGTTTPEPSSFILFGTGILGLLPFRRKPFGR
jgi:PEP-CTERM motif